MHPCYPGLIRRTFSQNEFKAIEAFLNVFFRDRVALLTIGDLSAYSCHHLRFYIEVFEMVQKLIFILLHSPENSQSKESTGNSLSERLGTINIQLQDFIQLKFSLIIKIVFFRKIHKNLVYILICILGKARGERLKYGVSHPKKKKKMLPKCVLGHLESLRTHLFLGEKWGVPVFLGIFDGFWSKFHEFR